MLEFIPATREDIPLLFQLAHTIWHSHYPGIISVEQIEYMLDKMYAPSVINKELNLGYSWDLIFDAHQPIGFIAYRVEDEGISVKLNKLYLLSQYHGKGYGNESLEYLKDKCNNLKVNKLYLTVNKRNAKAIKAYVKAGFLIEREVVTDIGNGYVMDDFIMAYTFSGAE